MTTSAFGNNLFKFSKILVFSATATFSPTTNGCLVVSPSRNFCTGVKSFSISLCSSSDIEVVGGLYTGKTKDDGNGGCDEGGYLKPPASSSSSLSLSSSILFLLKSLNLFNCFAIFKSFKEGAASNCFLLCFRYLIYPIQFKVIVCQL